MKNKILGFFCMVLLGSTAYFYKKSQPAPQSETSEEVSRDIANFSPNVSSRYQAMISEFRACKSGADIHQFLKKIEAEYDTLPADAKFAAARMTVYSDMAGIFWKFFPIISKVKMNQEVALAALRGMNEQLDIRYPDASNQAVFDFMTQPQSGDLSQFESEKDLQVFAAIRIYPSMVKAIERIKSFDFTKDQVFFDTQVRFGSDTVGINSKQRFQKVGKAEQNMLLAQLNRRLAQILLFSAYSVEGSLKFRASISKKIGWDTVGTSVGGFVNGKSMIGGIDREEVVSVFKEVSSKTGLGKAQNFGAISNKQLMMTAYHHFYSYVSYLRKAWAEHKVQGSSYVLSQSEFKGKESEINQALNNLKKMIPEPQSLKIEEVSIGGTSSGILGSFFKSVSQWSPKLVTSMNCPASSVVTSGTLNESRRINVCNFYLNPPSSLANLLPTQFAGNRYSGTSKKAMVTTKVDGKSVQFRDYEVGQATSWNQSSYSTLFPDLKDGGRDVKEHMRFLSLTYGGPIVGALVSPFIR